MTQRPSTVAEMLQLTARFIDAGETAIGRLATQQGRPAPFNGGTQVQDDLRALAAGLAADPELDARLRAFLP